jgi:hypothetical protein
MMPDSDDSDSALDDWSGNSLAQFDGELILGPGRTKSNSDAEGQPSNRLIALDLGKLYTSECQANTIVLANQGASRLSSAGMSNDQMAVVSTQDTANQVVADVATDPCRFQQRHGVHYSAISRQDHASAKTLGHVYVFSGRHGACILEDMWKFGLVSDAAGESEDGSDSSNDSEP